MILLRRNEPVGAQLVLGGLPDEPVYPARAQEEGARFAAVCDRPTALDRVRVAELLGLDPIVILGLRRGELSPVDWAPVWQALGREPESDAPTP